MKTRVVCFALSALLAVVADLSFGAVAGSGDCMTTAVKITPSSTPTQVTLIKEWDPYGGDSGTGGYCDWGAKWYYADFKKGGHYVVWFSNMSNSNCFFYVDVDVESSSMPFTQPGFENSADGSTTYYFWQNKIGYDFGWWDPLDPDTCRYYFYVGFGEVGDTCQLHVEDVSIAKYAVPGSALNPIAVDASHAGSQTVTPPAGGENCYFSAQLEKDVSYTFTCTPASASENVRLDFQLDDPEMLYDVDFRSDRDTGSYSFRICPQASVGITLSAIAENLSSCRLSWDCIHVGSVGFGVKELKVADSDGTVTLPVRRTSTEANIRLKWTTVAETALAGVDYEPMTGEIVLKAGGAAETTIPVKLISGSPRSEGEKTFAVRLASVGYVGFDEFSPTPVPQLVRVTITPTGDDAPVPVLPTPVEETPATALASGTFEGVLTGPISAAAVLTVGSGGQSATLTVDGRQYALVEDGADLKGQTVIDNATFDFFFTAKLPSGTVADLAGAPGEPAVLDGSIYLKRDGAVEEVFLKGPLYRVESRLNRATLSRMARKAGRYTLALAGEAGPGTPGGFGYLTLDVAGDGTVSGSGALADGTRIASLQAKANDVEGGLAIPLAWTSGTVSLSGLLVIGGAGGDLVWRDSRAQFGADGLSAREVRLSVLGGKYDYWTALDRLYRGWVLAANDPASPFRGLELCATKDGFADASSTVACSLDRETGVLTGSRGGIAFEAVLLNDAIEQGRLAAAGVAVGVSDERTDFSLQLNWTDSDQAEGGDFFSMISFDLNGADGSIPAIEGQLGATVVLPECPLKPTGLQFAGWLHPVTGAVLLPGAEIGVPAEDIALVAQWEDVRLKSALKTELNVIGDSKWVEDKTKAGATDGVCLKTSGLAVGETIVLETTVSGPGKVTFRWALDLFELVAGILTGNDKFEFFVDPSSNPTPSKTLAGKSDWTSVTVPVTGSGSHVLRWKFTASTLYGVGTGWMDLISWVSDTPTVTLSFDANGGSCSETSRQVPAGGTVSSLPVPTKAGYDFLGWYDGDVEKTVPFDVEGTDLALVARWKDAAAWVSFVAGPVDGTPPPAIKVFPGETCALPGVGDLGKIGYGFVGWWDGLALYDVGKTYQVSKTTEFAATWTNVQFNAWLHCDEGVGYYSHDEGAWTVDGGFLKVVGAKTAAARSVAELNGIAEQDGTVQFTWVMQGVSDDMFEFFVNGVRQTALTTSTGETRTPGYSVKRGQTMTWRYTCGSNVQAGKNVGLADVVLTRGGGYEVTVSWAEEAGVVGARYSVQDGVQDAEAVNGGKISVPSGKTVTVVGLADTNNWYVITGGDGEFAQATSTTLTAAKRDPGNLPQDVKPQDVGLSTATGAPFASADSAEVAKAMAWAQANGKTVSDMNALQFSAGDSGAPLNQVSEAYLLNCAPTDAAVAEAKAGFRFESFDPANPPTAETFSGHGYNGRVLILTTDSLSDPQWSETPGVSGTARFYKAELVK